MTGIILISGNLADMGFIPMMLDANDPDSAKEQLNKHYAHGGGWNEFSGFTREYNPALEEWRLVYPGDPPTYSVCAVQMRDEIVVVYRHAWVTVHNVATPDQFSCARMD